MSGTLQSSLAIVVDALEDEGIPYAVSGALAMAFHGYPRATQDLDIQVRVEDQAALDRALETTSQRPRRIEALTWRFDERWDVEFYLTQEELEIRALDGRVEGQLFEDHERAYWITPLEPLLVLKIREHLRYPDDLKHISDVRKLVTRNHDRLDVDRLDELLALDPAWEEAWDELVESA